MGRRVLLVEGKDDQHVMWNLFAAHAIPEEFAVECPAGEHDADEDGGIDRLLEALPRWLLQSNIKRLAVVVDANDAGPKARWHAIRDRLVSRGYEGTTADLQDDGTIFELSVPRTPRSVRFGAWIIPDNQSSGMLEDFVARLIAENDAMLVRTDAFLDSIPEDDRRFSPAHRSKARVHTWLAVSKRPGRPMGQAIRAEEHMDAHHPSVQHFLDWINKALVEDE